MTITNGYCTEAEFRDQLGDSATSYIDQDLIHKAINAASRAIDEYCSGGVPGTRRFWQDGSAVARVFAPDKSYRAWVDDISTTTGLVIKTDEDDDGTFETTWTAGTHYQLEPLNQSIAASTPFAWWEIVAVGDLRFPVYLSGRASLQVTAKFGWATVPEPVNQACILKSVALYRRKDAPFGVAGFSEFGPVRIGRNDPDVIELLFPFRKTRTRTLAYEPQAGSLFHWDYRGR